MSDASPVSVDRLPGPLLPAAAGAARTMVAALLLAWLAYLLVAPTAGVGWINSWHNEQRALQIVLLSLTSLGLCAATLESGFRGLLPRIHWTVYAVFLLGAASAARARYPAAALAELSLHLLLVVLVVFTATAVAVDPQRNFRWMRRGALLLLAAYAAGVAVNYAAAFSLWRPLRIDVLLLGYANIRFPSALHALLMPLAASLALDAREPRGLRLGARAVLTLIWAINLGLGTRAIWFADGISLALLWFVLDRGALWPLARLLLATALAGSGAYLLLFQAIPAWTGMGVDLSGRTLDQLALGSNRSLLLASSWEAIESHPWLGLGPMQFAAIPHVWAAHPHDWILQLASEWGLPALALALWGLRRLFLLALRAARSAPQDAAGPMLPLACAATIALVYGLVDGILVMPVSQSAAALVFGALLGCARAPLPATPAARPPALPRWTLALAAALLQAAAIADLAWYACATIGAAMQSEEAQRFFPTHNLWPRFWSDGMLPIRRP
jgi:O-antigen ligase